MTPREVSRRYSNGRVFEVVFRNGYRNKGICAKLEEGKSTPTKLICNVTGRLTIQE
jgi:hypothetical protein